MALGDPHRHCGRMDDADIVDSRIRHFVIPRHIVAGDTVLFDLTVHDADIDTAAANVVDIAFDNADSMAPLADPDRRCTEKCHLATHEDNIFRVGDLDCLAAAGRCLAVGISRRELLREIGNCRSCGRGPVGRHIVHAHGITGVAERDVRKQKIPDLFAIRVTLDDDKFLKHRRGDVHFVRIFPRPGKIGQHTGLAVEEPLTGFVQRRGHVLHTVARIGREKPYGIPAERVEVDVAVLRVDGPDGLP